MKVVIVGGVAGGASAAARLRRLDEEAEILVFERSGYMSYANCGLPYYIGGSITEQRALTLQSPQSFWSRFRVQVKVRHEVAAIDRVQKTVTVRALDSGEVWEESYDKLILAPGARPIIPDLPGIGSKRVYTLRTVEDTLQIRKKAAGSGAKSAVIIGGGFVGVEMAENLKELGLAVTLVEKAGQLLGQLDKDMASFIHAHIRSKGVELLLKSELTGFEETAGGILVKLDGGRALEASIAILAIGVRPDSTLAADAGLALGVRGTIEVNEHMQTSDPDIYAVGDAVSVPHLVTGEKMAVLLAGPANKQGRIAADNIAGLWTVYKGAAASSVVKVFEMTAASTGINERTAKAAGIPYDKIIVAPASHASYYPGGRVMTIKLLFGQEVGKILGAQIVGFDGVDKRIDVIAAVMQTGGTVEALPELDLAYAPPYSSAKDPVNMAGFAAENARTGKVNQFFYEDLTGLGASGATLLDVRTDAEYSAGHAEGFELHIPVDELRERLDELDKSKPVYVMCQSGLRSYIACRILTAAGYTCYNFAGGYRFYASVKNDELNEEANTDCGLKC